MKRAKSKKGKELDVVRSEFIRAFNFVTRLIRMNRPSRKVTLGLVQMVLSGVRISIQNASITFGLNYGNLLKALEYLEGA